MEVPKGMIAFKNLEICSPYVTKLRNVFLCSILVFIGSLSVSVFAQITMIFAIVGLLCAALILAIFAPDLYSIISTPLGVDMNHPFVDEEPIGNATVMVKFSDNKWIELEDYRVRLVEDELLGGYNLVEDNEDYKTIGHYSKTNKKTTLMKQVIIINQALSRRDAVNGECDPIDSARDREQNDSGLLDREWMEEEQMIIEGPISKFMNKE